MSGGEITLPALPGRAMVSWGERGSVLPRAFGSGCGCPEVAGLRDVGAVAAR